MPAFTARPDLLRLAAATDRIALVVQAGKTALAGMRKANALLNETASTVMGAILNQYREYVPGSLGEHV
jgi:Mrp family chromosome partitioning ATPase